MTYTKDGYWTVKAKKWLEENKKVETLHPVNSVLAFASFLDGEEERKFGDFVDMLSGAPRKEEKLCEHIQDCLRGTATSEDVVAHIDCVFPKPPQVVEELESGSISYDTPHMERATKRILLAERKINELVRILNSLSKR